EADDVLFVGDALLEFGDVGIYLGVEFLVLQRQLKAAGRARVGHVFVQSLAELVLLLLDLFPDLSLLASGADGQPQRLAGERAARPAELARILPAPLLPAARLDA